MKSILRLKMMLMINNFIIFKTKTTTLCYSMITVCMLFFLVQQQSQLKQVNCETTLEFLSTSSNINTNTNNNNNNNDSTITMIQTINNSSNRSTINLNFTVTSKLMKLINLILNLI